MSSPQLIKADELLKRNQLQSVIVDVRTPVEFANIRLATENILMPLGEFDPQKLLLLYGLDQDTPVYLLCASGHRAANAAPMLTGFGFTNVAVIEGGLTACFTAGMQLTGPGAATAKTAGHGISLERQVRIAAGCLVALGVILSIFVATSFIYLSLFIGCGLIFSGVTNTCGIAIILAKAPWNKGSSCQGGSCGGNTPPSALTQGKSCS